MEQAFEGSHVSASKEETILFIIDEYGEQIKRLIYTYVKNHTLTDDIFQEFLIKVFEKMDQFQGQSSFKTWLYRIAINKCKDYLRSPIHRILPFREQANINGSVRSTEKVAIERERNQLIVESIFSLPIKYREIFVLRFYQDFSIRQISEALGVEESTVRSRIMRGKKKLKTKLGGEYFE